MSSFWNRRRFLSVSAAGLAFAGTSTAASPSVTTWRGSALGAACSMQLVGLDNTEATPILSAVRAELFRLEAIFSLYRSTSELSRLNRDGVLPAPSPELLEVLSTCGLLHRATEGAFDPTVQPLFAFYSRALTDGRRPTNAEIEVARALVGWDDVIFDIDAVRLTRPGAGLTLNGVAQGFITDRIAALLRTRALRNVLVDMGEVMAMGRSPSNDPWRAGVADPQGEIVRRIQLSDRALATSVSEMATAVPDRWLGHIFDPASGRQAGEASLVSVSAKRADLADGLSTALCAVPVSDHVRIAQAVPGARIEVHV